MSDQRGEYEEDGEWFPADWQPGDPIEDHPDFDDNYVVIPTEESFFGDLSGIDTPEQMLERLRELGITNGTIATHTHDGWSVQFTAPEGNSPPLKEIHRP